MPRVLLVVAWIAVTIYAVADWSRAPEDEMPGRIPKPMWLVIIVFTTMLFAIGAIVWLVLRWVNRAEARGHRPPPGPKGPVAPDDDPEFLFRLERDIQRKRRQEQQRRSEEEGPAEPSD